MDDSWRIGEYPLENGLGFPVFLTLGCWPERIMELIIDCWRLTRNGYLLLGTNRHILTQTCEEMLDEDGATFLPLNETLDFNRETELYLMQPVNIEEMAVRRIKKEPDNIFRKRGDVWEIRFQGGKKFMLTGVNTGTEYIRYMLERPNIRISLLDITAGNPRENSLPEKDFLENYDGYSVEDLPVSSSGLVADSKAVSEYQEEMENLSIRIEDAKEIGDYEQMTVLQEELLGIRKIVNEAISPDGQKRILKDPMRKIENSFRGAVKRTIRKISNYDKALYKHLKKSIKCGINPVYKPPKDIRWEIKSVD